MNTVEQLHQKIDELNEAQQQELLATVNELLSEETQKMLLERYEHAKAHPETLVDVRESNKRLRERLISEN